MKGIIISVMILFFCKMNTLGQSRCGGIKFTQGGDWTQIKVKAQAQGKYIFLDCFTTWCLPCKEMEKEVYSNDTLGCIMNNRFISVKLQMDKTIQDDLSVKEWYADVQKLKKVYKVDKFPTFLFFSPNGKLVFRDYGFKNVNDFARLVRKSLDSSNLEFSRMVEDYKKGEKNYKKMFELANYEKSIGDQNLATEMANNYINSTNKKELLNKDKILFVLEVANNSRLAKTLANQFKAYFINSMNDSELLKKENLDFLDRFSDLITSKDRIFKLCYNAPNKIDSIIEIKGWSNEIVKATITREEFEQKILKNGHSLQKNPNWTALMNFTQKKYRAVDASMIMIDFQLKYYKALKNWPSYTRTLIKRVEKYGAFGIVTELDFNLNNHAWDLFEHSFKKIELAKALQWSDSAIILCTNSNKANWMDTKANLLYKLGRIDEAVTLENEVIALDPDTKDFQINLEKMKSRKPTWPDH